MLAISVKNLTKVFSGPAGSVVALNDISFDIEEGAFASIVGPSGCGKSTLLNILAGIEQPTSGSAEVLARASGSRVGYVFQEARLLPWRTVLDNMLFVHEDRSPEVRERAQACLRMAGLGHMERAFPGQLSGGMQQRVGIARAFSIQPQALLMDEPFSHLDAFNARQLRRELSKIWFGSKSTVVFVTHDVAEAVELSTRVIIMEKGGKVRADMTIDLPYPRDPGDPQLALLKARVLTEFEDLEFDTAAQA